MEGADPMSIFLPAPLLLVWVGTIGVGIAGHTVKDVIESFKAVPRALMNKVPDPTSTVDTLVDLADRARREGLLALEDAAKDIDDEFLRGGLQAAIDGTDPDDLRMILEDKIATKRSREKVWSKYFADMGGYAPTIGIIGTVISLVHVLENLSDPASLGHSIAAAFVATLWGILSANVVWLPLGARIKRFSDLECAQMEVTLEGLLAVQAGANPRLVGERLRSLLPDTPVAKEAA
jgi:chemotaxis protein MotA